jgi:hypothetical protein
MLLYECESAERWEQAVREQDLAKLLGLTTEIERLLAAK